ncbi:hypothetical protein MAC_07717 [Metarhizium acridum CQMa 102]|uniref:Uncharacterized protein n=1 Tax=Metarhizium acridum (strain CQMa 102) TaxID=655827 RepID=E9ECW9_METAQ|nr:uncharacterized protein MAC_07717 [Metarhizium acridum CQMa 102]EFY86263.1 hypothetical protein MAC_07717 [Metarhizium acridum CQMa 102]
METSIGDAERSAPDVNRPTTASDLNRLKPEAAQYRGTQGSFGFWRNSRPDANQLAAALDLKRPGTEAIQHPVTQGSFTNRESPYAESYQRETLPDIVSPIEASDLAWAPDNMPSEPPHDSTSMPTSDTQDSINSMMKGQGSFGPLPRPNPTTCEVKFAPDMMATQGFFTDSEIPYPSAYELEVASKKGLCAFISKIFRCG